MCVCVFSSSRKCIYPDHRINACLVHVFLFVAFIECKTFISENLRMLMRFSDRKPVLFATGTFHLLTYPQRLFIILKLYFSPFFLCSSLSTVLIASIVWDLLAPRATIVDLRLLLAFNLMLLKQKQIRVDSALYGNVILIVILASNIWSSHGQNVNPQNDDAADYVNAGGGGGGGSNSAERDRVQSSGEVMASRLPVLNENEPSCEELKAMWRYVYIN